SGRRRFGGFWNGELGRSVGDFRGGGTFHYFVGRQTVFAHFFLWLARAGLAGLLGSHSRHMIKFSIKIFCGRRASESNPPALSRSSGLDCLSSLLFVEPLRWRLDRTYSMLINKAREIVPSTHDHVAAQNALRQRSLCPAAPR